MRHLYDTLNDWFLEGKETSTQDIIIFYGMSVFMVVALIFSVYTNFTF